VDTLSVRGGEEGLGIGVEGARPEHQQGMSNRRQRGEHGQDRSCPASGGILLHLVCPGAARVGTRVHDGVDGAVGPTVARVRGGRAGPEWPPAGGGGRRGQAATGVRGRELPPHLERETRESAPCF